MSTTHPRPSEPNKTSAADGLGTPYLPTPTTGSVPSRRKAEHYYGHEYIARLCARFITHLFDCPEYPPSALLQVKLPQFIAYALHRTKLHPSITCASLVLLQRLKGRFPTARGSSGHQLFIAAFMIASKVICEDTYSNKSWTIVAQELFTLREINQMEREMCNYLDWDLTMDNSVLSWFEAAVKQDFRSPHGPYPFYSLQVVSKRAGKAASLSSTAATSPIPSFRHGHVSPKASSKISSSLRHRDIFSCSDPSPSMHEPPSSASPRILTGPENFAVNLNGVGVYDRFSMCEAIPLPHPLKSEMFGYASPCCW